MHQMDKQQPWPLHPTTVRTHSNTATRTETETQDDVDDASVLDDDPMAGG